MKAGIRFCHNLPRGTLGTTYISETKLNPCAQGVYIDMIAYDGNGFNSDPGGPSSLFPWRFNREWISSGLAQYQSMLSGRRQCAPSNLMTRGWNFNCTPGF